MDLGFLYTLFFFYIVNREGRVLHDMKTWTQRSKRTKINFRFCRWFEQTPDSCSVVETSVRLSSGCFKSLRPPSLSFLSLPVPHLHVVFFFILYVFILIYKSKERTKNQQCVSSSLNILRLLKLIGFYSRCKSLKTANKDISTKI